MKATAITWLAVLVAGVGFLLPGCESGSGADESTNPEGKPMGMSPPFGGQEDVARARKLWRTIEARKSWSAYPGYEGWQDGKSPHGRYLRYHINAVAKVSPDRPAAGSIIVKENYMTKDLASPGPITVMQRISGYDPENGDWFWVKFAPDGSVMKNPKGMLLAGRVAKGMPQGCIACHANAGGNDFLFVNDG